MQSLAKYPLFWWRWLVAAAIAVILFGISMVLAPGLIRQGFSLILYSAPEHIDTFGTEAVAYIALVHAILGAVLFGWGFALLYTLLGPFRRGSREGWQILVVSIAAWIIPDTAFSLWSGFWQNAVLNLAFAVLFGVPLAATYRAFHAPRT